MIGRVSKSASQDEEEVVADDDVAAAVKLADREWGRVRYLGTTTDVAIEFRRRRDILVIVPLTRRRRRSSDLSFSQSLCRNYCRELTIR